MPVQIEVKVREEVRTFQARPGERLLHAGLRSGVDLPYECATGTCGTCKAKLVSGVIENLWADAPGRKHCVGTAEILLCQCTARSDCALEVAPRNFTPVPKATPDFGMGLVRGARVLAPGVMAFSVELDRPIDFEAGQFVALQFDHEPGFRSYSMVNHAPGSARLDFVVKRKPDGRLTPWLFETDLEGREVEWFGPLGRAIFEPGRPHDLLCIAGGTGIAGMMSILRCAAQSGHFAHSKAHVYFGVRTLADAFYLDELQGLAEEARGALEVTIALSEEQPAQAASAAHPQLAFRHGLVHDVAKAGMAGRLGDVVAYLAGPAQAVDASMRVLLAARVPVRNIRFDKFG